MSDCTPGKTRCMGVFAGGDAVLTPMTVVHCVSTARKAATAIDILLTTGKMPTSLPVNLQCCFALHV